MVKIFVDTDFGIVYDDAAALAVLHSLEDMGEAEIVGMVSAIGNPFSVGALSAINTYFGRPDIPLGGLKDQTYHAHEDIYARYLVEHYPTKIKTIDEAPDAVTLMRKVFSEQPDKSVIFVELGGTRNLKELLESKPDMYSDKNGKELIAQKIKKLCIMGGSFNDKINRIDNPGGVPTGWTYNWSGFGGNYTKFTFDNWPTEINITTSEVGYQVRTGKAIYEVKKDNPIKDVYKLYSDKVKGTNKTTDGAWDQITVIQAVRGYRPYFSIIDEGHCRVDDEGCSFWEEYPKKSHAYGAVLQERIKEISELIEELMVYSLKLRNIS